MFMLILSNNLKLYETINLNLKNLYEVYTNVMSILINNKNWDIERSFKVIESNLCV